MWLTIADLPDISLLAGNDELNRAFAEANAKLSAFVAAMTEAQSTADPAPSAADPPSAAAGVEPKAPAAVVAAASTPVEPPVASHREKAPPAIQDAPDEAAPAKARERVEHDSQETKAHPVGSPSKKHGRPAAARAAEAAAEALDTRAASTAQEDEALLASLDPETAKAIRVMRRLSIEKKSVRELLEEYHAGRQSGNQAEQRKKSWWSRG